MAALAVLIKQEILLIFIGGVYVMEALSVIIQVIDATSLEAHLELTIELARPIPADPYARNLATGSFVLVDRDNNAFGVLQVDTLDQKHRFRENDLDLLVATAAQASIAITNAKMHEDSLKRKSIERDIELKMDEAIRERVGHSEDDRTIFFAIARSDNRPTIR